MCGIIGYVGHKPCVENLFDGLKRLEYRGYDSSGIAVGHDSKISLVKAAGKLSQLKPLVEDLPKQATVGLGHTRWATHGPPVTRNAHPHVTEGIAIVHNGIIENYRDLKAGLEAGGVEFCSDTDTEVVLHLLREELSKAEDAHTAILELIKKLKGAFSLGILLADQPDHIFLVKQGSPLVIGLSDGENFFASDVAALIQHTRRTVVLQDGQFAKLSADGMELWDFDGHTVEIVESELDWSAESIEKAGYPSYMLKEINEQPAVLSRMIARFVDLENCQVRIDELGLAKLEVDRIKHIHLIACGTAYLSGAVARYFLESSLEIPCNVELASEFRYRDPCVGRDSLVIAISQSGETIDTLEAIKHARSRGAQILSVCNKPHTEIPRYSDATLYMDCGPEIGVASTKAFTAMVMSLYFVTVGLALLTKKRSADSFREEFDHFRLFPHAVQRAIDLEDAISSIAQDYFESTNFLFIGRGVNAAIASEAALKLKEISYIHAEGYAAGELKHGPIALVDRHMPILAIVANDRYYDKTVANIEEVRAREGRIIVLGPEKDSQIIKVCDHFIECPQLDHPALQAILNTIPLQLFAYHMAVLRGTDVDQPRNLAKSVTVE